MSGFEALILGVGDAFTLEHFGSSALLRAPEGLVLIDCPDHALRAIRRATTGAGWDAPLTAITDILLTHLHGDHCNGLEAFLFSQWVAMQQGARARRVRIHTSPLAAARLWDRLAPAMDTLIGVDRPLTLVDYAELCVLRPENCFPDTERASGDGVAARVAGMEVRCRYTTHHIPTIGLKIGHGERTLGWSGDTRPDMAHVEWLREADLIVHEASPPPAHTPVEWLNALPEPVRKKMRLLHLPDGFDARGSRIPVLREGEVLKA